jgi:crossover junction endodeoxyribonuclease RusA
MDLDFPLEFLVNGTPVSLQAKRAESREQWKVKVREACRPHLPDGHFLTEDRLAVTIYYLPPGRMPGDIDNIVKPILDALCRHVYLDDQQIERVAVQKFEPGSLFQFTAPTDKVAEALISERPVVYVRISNDPYEDFTR